MNSSTTSHNVDLAPMMCDETCTVHCGAGPIAMSRVGHRVLFPPCRGEALMRLRLALLLVGVLAPNDSSSAHICTIQAALGSVNHPISM
jgi:hypothetical protein